MSPHAGGDSAKAGDRYELELAAEALLDVLTGKASSVEIESVDDPAGVEFRVTKVDGSHVFHQAKRQRANGPWTIKSLADVLATFGERLETYPDARCRFTSGTSADQLAELVERADPARDVADMEGRLGSERLVHWKDLCGALGDGKTREHALDVLQRIEVETVNEARLRRDNEFRAEVALTGNPASAVDALVALAFKSRRILDAAETSRHLATRGISQRAADAGEARSAQNQTEAYATTVARAALSAFRLPRRQATEIATKVAEGDLLVTGHPGAGKSTVLRDVVDRVKAAGSDVIAVRLDRLAPVPTPRALGRRLGLDGSPVATLARLAEESGRPALLVIDQLDAVSLVSGRRAQFLECVRALVDETRTVEGVNVLVACRQFDLDNDLRLSTFVRDFEFERLALAPPSGEEVRTALRDNGAHPDRLSPGQIETLANPLLLSVFLQVESDARAYDFATPADLFACLWDAASTAAGDPAVWVEVVDTLASEMSASAALTAPRARVDRWSDAVGRLVELGALNADGEQLAFFHETFFDYVYARCFVAAGRHLMELVNDGEQLLFRRAQVRQVLDYERAADHVGYVRDLRDLLCGPGVRTHLKATALSQLAARDDPMPEELTIIETLLADASDPVGSRPADALRGGGWPELLDALGRLDEWLACGDDRYISIALDVLRVSHEQLGGRIAELLEPYAGCGDTWHQRIYYVLSWGDLHVDRAVFDLYLGLLDAGFLDAPANGARVWTDVARLDEHRPEWAAELLGRFYGRRLDRGDRNPFESASQRDDGPDTDFLGRVAKAAPTALLDAALDVVLETARRSATPRGNAQPVADTVWYYRSGDRHGPSEVVLGGVEDALAEVARSGPDALDPYASRLLDSELEIAQYLLYVAWSAADDYADTAINHLSADPTRLVAMVGQNDYWQTRLLMARATKTCRDEALERLETMLLVLDPKPDEPELSTLIAQEAQFTLLSAIPQERIGAAASARLAELQARYGAESPSEPAMGGMASFVGPPMSEPDARALDDDGWLAAVARFADDRRDDTDPFVGGATQLAGLMQRLAEEDPNRFSRIGSRLPDDANPVYFEHLLIALGQTGIELDGEAVQEFCLRCHKLPGRPCGRWIAWPLARIAGSHEIGDAVIDMVSWYATEDPDPDGTDPEPDGDLDDNESRDPWSTGINTVRGATLRWLTAIIAHHPEGLGKLKPTLEHGATDGSIAVRACAAEPLIAALASDPEWAISTYLRLIDAPDQILVAQPVEQFVAFAARHDAAAMIPVVQRMLDSPSDAVRAVGARRATLLTLDYAEAEPLLSIARDGDEIMRRNVAGVFAHNLARDVERYTDGLATFFDDKDTEVRKQAADVFRLLPDTELGAHAELVDAFLMSQAFVDSANQVLLACEIATQPLPALTLNVCRAWLDRIREIETETERPLGGDALTVAELTVRAYTQADSPDLHTRALDILDDLIAQRAYGVDRVLAAAEAAR